MNETHVTELLDAHVAGELDAADEAAVLAHLGVCAECAAAELRLRDSLQALREQVATLATETEPSPAVWSGIRAAISEPGHAPFAAPRASRSRAWLIAAALLVVAGASSALTALWMRTSRRAVVAETSVPPRTVVPVSAPTQGTAAVLADFTLAENEYLRAAAELSATLDRERDQLSPETVASVTASLQVIDRAILEARAALARDPANRALAGLLAATYEQKLDLLRRTTRFAGAGT